MKKLDGSELAGYIKERQVKEVRRLEADKILPKLAIISEGDNKVNELYLKIKQQYGQDIGVDVQLVKTNSPVQSKQAIMELNDDTSIKGIIVQLPISDPVQTDDVVNLIKPNKDVDGLGENAKYDSATATAIIWLLTGYNVELRGKRVVIIGRGRLVGQPLLIMLQASGFEPEVIDENSGNLQDILPEADVVISATGQPGLVTPDLLKNQAVVVDAGSASEGGQVKGDLADSVYEREDLTITPQKGGLGPLTVAVLFDNVLKASRDKVSP